MDKDTRTTIKLNARMQAIVGRMIEVEPVLTGGSPTKAVELALMEWYQKGGREMETMLRFKGVELLVLHTGTAAQAFGLFEGFPFDDNGGDPDGPSWYCETGDVSADEIAAVEAANLGYVTEGVMATGYDGSDAHKEQMQARFGFRWCGYSSRAVAYGIEEGIIED